MFDRVSGNRYRKWTRYPANLIIIWTNILNGLLHQRFPVYESHEICQMSDHVMYPISGQVHGHGNPANLILENIVSNYTQLLSYATFSWHSDPFFINCWILFRGIRARIRNPCLVYPWGERLWKRRGRSLMRLPPHRSAHYTKLSKPTRDRY